MKFHEYKTLYQDRRSMQDGRLSSLGDQEFYEAVAGALQRRGGGRIIRAMGDDGPYLVSDDVHELDKFVTLCEVEKVWYRRMRPYYKVWPGIAEALLKIKLDRPAPTLRLPMDKVLLIRFATGHELTAHHDKITSVLIMHRMVGELGVPVLFVITPEGGNWLMRTSAEGNVDDVIAECVVAHIEEQGRAAAVCDTSIFLKMAFSILLMSKDPDFIKPDVLAADRDEYAQTGDPKLVEKARKKGVVGWNVGESYEMIPHYRRPHLALYWTGKGGTIPKILPVKGCVVHRDKATTVPTGYITPEPEEKEVEYVQ